MRAIFLAALLFSIPLNVFTKRSDARNSTALTLDEQVRAAVSEFKGKVSLFAKNLDTGATYDFGGDNRVRTASTIKIPVMIEAFARVAEGKAKWSDAVVLTDAKKVQ